MSTAQPSLSDDDYAFLLSHDEAYFEACLVIRTKSGGLEPLRLNASQRFAHEQIEDQLRRTGRVRKLILKGRQQGISTYVGGRFYKKATCSRGSLVFIMTHLEEATQNLFGMVNRFHENNLPDFKPKTGAANAKELIFPLLDSSYKLATAGGRAPGRSTTIQLFHASEFGFWTNAEENMAGALEAVADAPGTEVIIESTANQPGDHFHRAWQAAKAGDSTFEPLFIPWHIHEEYAKPPPPGWTPPPEFAIYQRLHRLTDAQVYWAWSKNRDMAMTLGLGSDTIIQMFKREYPATDDEAFEQAGDDLTRVIPLAWIRAAQQRWLANRDKPLKPMSGLGVDVAQGGADSTALAPLHGVRFDAIKKLPGAITTDGPAVAAAVVQHIRDGATIAIDLGGGWGGSAYDHLKNQLNMRVIGVNPANGSSAKTSDGKLTFRNERAALHWQFREALDPVNGEGVELPPDEELAQDLSAPTFEVKPSGIQIEAKDALRDRLGRSPDKGDAVLLAWRAGEDNARRSAFGLVGPGGKLRSPPVQRQYGKVVGKR